MFLNYSQVKASPSFFHASLISWIGKIHEKLLFPSFTVTIFIVCFSWLLIFSYNVCVVMPLIKYSEVLLESVVAWELLSLNICRKTRETVSTITSNRPTIVNYFVSVSLMLNPWYLLMIDAVRGNDIHWPKSSLPLEPPFLYQSLSSRSSPSLSPLLIPKNLPTCLLTAQEQDQTS